MFGNEQISLTEATVLALQGKLKLEETKPTRKRKLESKQFNHIDDVWEYLEQSKNEEDLEERINDIPRGFGIFTYDIINNGRTARITNQYEEYDDISYDTVDIDFIDLLDETKKVKKESVNINVDDAGNTTVDTEEATVTVNTKKQEAPLATEPQETIDVPVEGDETIVPEEEVDKDEFEGSLDESKKVEDYAIKINKDNIKGYWGCNSDGIDNNNNVDKNAAKIFKSRNAAQREINKHRQEMGDAQIEKINKNESKSTFNKKSFEEALTRFYRFNSRKVESFKVKSIATNSKGLKVEGYLVSKTSRVPATMKFRKINEGRNSVRYCLINTNGILKESKDVTTNLMISTLNNELNCKYIISK